MKMKLKRAIIVWLVLFLACSTIAASVSATTPPYPGGGCGQSNEGTSEVYLSHLHESEGKIDMYGVSSVGMAQSGWTSSWGQYECQYFTASQTGALTFYTNVKYQGVLRLTALAIMWAYASSYVSVWQDLKVYDTSNWQVVAQDSRVVAEKTLSGGSFYSETWDRSFNSEIVGRSCTFTATQGHTYVAVVRISCNAQAAATGIASASALYNFWDSNWVQIMEISHT